MPIISVGNREVLEYLKSQPYFHEWKEGVLHEQYDYFIRSKGTTKDAKVAKLITLLGAQGINTINVSFDWEYAPHGDPQYWSKMDDYMSEKVFSERLFKQKHISSTGLDYCYYYHDNCK